LEDIERDRNELGKHLTISSADFDINNYFIMYQYPTWFWVLGCFCSSTSMAGDVLDYSRNLTTAAELNTAGDAAKVERVEKKTWPWMGQLKLR